MQNFKGKGLKKKEKKILLLKKIIKVSAAPPRAGFGVAGADFWLLIGGNLGLQWEIPLIFWGELQIKSTFGGAVLSNFTAWLG